jgi:hypothetical protein
MNLKHALAGVVTAVALTAGLAGSAGAQTSEDTTADLDPAADGVVCALTVNGGNPIDFGVYVYDGTDYLQGGSRASAVDFSVEIDTDLYPTDCEVDVSGTDLVNGPNSIPVGRIALAQDGGTVVVSPVAALSGADQLFIGSVGGDPLGNGTALATATLTLTNADDVNPPGIYTGTITFTGTPDVAP